MAGRIYHIIDEEGELPITNIEVLQECFHVIRTLSCGKKEIIRGALNKYPPSWYISPPPKENE